MRVHTQECALTLWLLEMISIWRHHNWITMHARCSFSLIDAVVWRMKLKNRDFHCEAIKTRVLQSQLISVCVQLARKVARNRGKTPASLVVHARPQSIQQFQLINTHLN